MDDEVVISEGNKPILLLILAAFLYTTIFYIVYLIIRNFILFGFNKSSFGYFLVLFSFTSWIFVYALKYSVTTTKYFNLKELRYKNEFSVGIIKYGKWKKLPKLEYVSVFYTNDMYEVNIWYFKNKHFNLYNFFDKNESFKVASKVSKSLKIKLLDATDKNNFKWIEMKT